MKMYEIKIYRNDGKISTTTIAAQDVCEACEKFGRSLVIDKNEIEKIAIEEIARDKLDVLIQGI